MAEENQKPNPNELTIQDLAILKGIIELSTERGVFKAPELSTVGIVYNKLEMFLKEVEAQAKADKEGNEAAQQPPVEQPEEVNANG